MALHPRPALRASGSPPAGGSCICLRVGTAWCMEGEGCVLGWRLLWQQRVKANLPGHPLARPGQRPHPRPADAPDWAPGWREQLSLGFGGADRSSSCHGPPGHCGPCPSGTLGHTLYRPPCPHTQSLSSQLHFIILTKSPPKVPAAVSTVPPTLVLTWPIQDGAGPRASDPFPDPQPPPAPPGGLPAFPPGVLGPSPLPPWRAGLPTSLAPETTSHSAHLFSHICYLSYLGTGPRQPP